VVNNAKKIKKDRMWRRSCEKHGQNLLLLRLKMNSTHCPWSRKLWKHRMLRHMVK